MPKREQSTEVAARKPYSPFQTNNTVDYTVARVDDLVNWARKVIILVCITRNDDSELGFVSNVV